MEEFHFGGTCRVPIQLSNGTFPDGTIDSLCVRAIVLRGVIQAIGIATIGAGSTDPLIVSSIISGVFLLANTAMMVTLNRRKGKSQDEQTMDRRGTRDNATSSADSDIASSDHRTDNNPATRKRRERK